MACTTSVDRSGRWRWEDGSTISDRTFRTEADAIADWKKTLAEFKGSWLNPPSPPKNV